MKNGISRRSFLEGTAAGAAAMSTLTTWPIFAADAQPTPTPPKLRLGKVYFGYEHPSWPKDTVDVDAERRRVEGELARIQPQLPDVEWIDCGVVDNEDKFAQAKEKLQGADGILFLQLTMGARKTINSLLELGLPLVWFSEPFCGHEWCTAAAMQQKEGKRFELVASSKYEDIVPALRPVRALARLKRAKVLHVSQHPADAAYVKAIKEKFGTEIVSLGPKDLEEAYNSIPDADVEADMNWWVSGAEKVVEPSREDLLKAARMALAVEKMVAQLQADVITINCLGMGLLNSNMGYPCWGFCRLNNRGLGGVCEADLYSTMTHLIFVYMVGRPGFVSDPCFDLSNNTILHAHCVAATKMLGPDGPSHPYIIRSHLEDNKSAVLQVKLPVGQKVTMARLIGPDVLLYSTGEAVQSPLLDRGCRTKLVVRVDNAEKILLNWTSGLHRVIFYGEHEKDVGRFCRLAGVRLFREGQDDPRDVPSLGWYQRVRA